MFLKISECVHNEMDLKKKKKLKRIAKLNSDGTTKVSSSMVNF